MQVTVQKLSPVLVELAVQVEADRVKSELSKAYSSLARTAKVRGFRPGKAPRKILAHMFGPRVAVDVARRLVDETFTDAVNEQNVQAVSQPSIEPEELVENKPFSYKARVEILPEIESVDYDGFEVEKPKVEVTAEAIKEELDSLRRANSTLEAPKTERGAQKGDVVTVDFTVDAGGVRVDDAGADGFQAELGGGTFLEAIEASLMGKKVGESATADVEMAPGHPHPGLAGKTATFNLVIKDLKERVLPEADDEFAKDLGEYETLADLEKDLSQQIEKRLTEASENQVAEALVRKLVEKNPIEVPPTLVQQQMRVSEQEILQMARARGQQGEIPPELRGRIQQDAEVKVRAGLLMAEIAKKEAIQIGDPEVEEGIKELAEQTGKNAAKLRAEYRDPKRREMLVGMILENKVLDIIQAKAKITEAAPE
jgi:trigger factor